VSDSLQEAVDKLRRHYEAIKTDATFSQSPYYIEYSGVGRRNGWFEGELCDDESLLARAYLAEHDDRPLTEEWLTKVGGVWDEHQFAHGFRWMRITLWVRINGQVWLTCDSTYGGRVCLYKTFRTCGDVVRIAEAHGIELISK